MEGPDVLSKCSCGAIGKKREGKTLGLLGWLCWDCLTELPNSWRCAGRCNITKTKDDIHAELPDGRFICQSCYAKNPDFGKNDVSRFMEGITALLREIDIQIGQIPKNVQEPLTVYRDSLAGAQRPSLVERIISDFLVFLEVLKTRARRWKTAAQEAVAALYELLKSVKEALDVPEGPKLIPLLKTR